RGTSRPCRRSRPPAGRPVVRPPRSPPPLASIPRPSTTREWNERDALAELLDIVRDLRGDHAGGDRPGPPARPRRQAARGPLVHPLSGRVPPGGAPAGIDGRRGDLP